MNALQRIAAAVGFAVLVSSVPTVLAANTVIVGGAEMYPTRTIVENAVNSKDHTTLVAAVKAAGLVDTLNGAGPFTVFAPTNAAFEKLPAGTVDTLVKPENKAQLTRILTYHVVPGNYSSAQLLADARKHGGKATLKTVQGEPLPWRSTMASSGSSTQRVERQVSALQMSASPTASSTWSTPC